MPLSCARMPGACPAMQIRAEADSWKTGRGSWFRARPLSGCSMQILHVRISSARASSGIVLCEKAFKGSAPGCMCWGVKIAHLHSCRRCCRHHADSSPKASRSNGCRYLQRRLDVRPCRSWPDYEVEVIKDCTGRWYDMRGVVAICSRRDEEHHCVAMLRIGGCGLNCKGLSISADHSFPR